MMSCLLYRGNFRYSWRTIPPMPPISDSKSPAFEITATDRNHTGDANATIFSFILVEQIFE